MTETSSDQSASWKSALTKIIEELSDSQYTKMLLFLEKVPKSERTSKTKVEMAELIIECYGEDESISAIDSVMRQIPRNDPAVQNLLRPFVERLKAVSRGEKRKRAADSGSGSQNTESDSESSDEEPEADDAENIPNNKEIKIPPWRISIQQLKASGEDGGRVIAGKVVKKSGLRTYKSKKKENNCFFYLGLADETGSITAMVYGREKFEYFQEGKFYTFRKTIVERRENEDIVKVTGETTTPKTGPLDVPQHLELEAQMLIYKQSPVYSIQQIRALEERTCVSVEGTVAEINDLRQVKIKKKRSKVAVLNFEVKDENDRVKVKLWEEATNQLTGTSVGDVVKVLNVKIRRYFDTVSLNSTGFTRIIKVQRAAVQQTTLQVIGILKADRTRTQLEAHASGEVETFTVGSALLAEALQVQLEGDLEETVLKKIPFSAEAEIQGNQILKLKVDMCCF